MFPSSLKCLIHKRLVHLSLIPFLPFFHLHNVQLILQTLVSLFGYTAPTGSHKFRNSLCSISHLVNGSTGVVLPLLFLERLLVYSSHLLTTSVQYLWEFLLLSYTPLCLCALTFYWILTPRLCSLATIFPQPGTFLPCQSQVFWRGFPCHDTHAEWDVP